MREYRINTAYIAPLQRSTAFEKMVAPLGRPLLEKKTTNFSPRARLTEFPGGSAVAQVWHSPAIYRRTLPLATALGDKVMAHINLSGEAIIRQGPQGDVHCAPGWVYLDPMQSPGVVHYQAPGVNIVYIAVPWQPLFDIAPVMALMLRQRVCSNKEWNALLAAISNLHRRPDGDMALNETAFEAHLIQLFADACNASAQQMGIVPRHASRETRKRLVAIKNLIEERLIDPDLSAEKIAALSGISTRYLRLLFAREEISFTDYVNARRLARVHEMIIDPEKRALPIGRLALNCGFNDPSRFTSQFRRAFGAAPSDIRAQAIVQWQARQLASA